MQLTKAILFLLEDELRRLSGYFEKTDDWLPPLWWTDAS